MKSYVQGIFFSIAFSLCFVMGGYFFSLTNITLNSFLTINSLPLIDSIISLNFILACISTSIGLGILISLGSFYEIKEACIISIPFYVLSVLITTLAFNQYSFFAPLLLGGFAIPICFTSLQKAREMKTFPILRAGIYSSGKFILIIGGTLFLVLLTIGLFQAGELENNFNDEMLSIMIGDNLTLSDEFTFQLSSSIATNQKKVIDLMLEQEELKNLIESDSIDAINYEQKLLAYKDAYSSEEYQSKIASELKDNKVNFGEEVMPKFPIIITFAKYSFILYPLSAFILIMFIGNMILKNIAGLIFSIIVKYVPNREETEKKAY